MSRVSRRMFAAALIPLVLLAPVAFAEQAIRDEAPVPTEGAEPEPSASDVIIGSTVSRAALAAYVDGVVQAFMLREGVAGATVAVVDRGGTLLFRGYGRAQFDPERAVDPERTLFRIGSTSKTFTYLATLQLVEQGKLALDDEINRHLPEQLRVPDQGFGPIRVWHLMTHTAGFEDSALGHLIGNDPARELSLEDYLAVYRPARVRTPGTHAVYSNYSVALLGAIVARVSGEPFEDYVERHLFAPLGMDRTTFREPLPVGDPRRIDDALGADFSRGFERRQGGFRVKPFEFIAHGAPAGAASSTATDMARYMRMLLAGGRLDEAVILEPETFAQLRKIRFRNAPEVGGLAHGFFVQPFGAFESLQHGGATLNFHTAMTVLPEAGLGVFVSTNTDTGRKLAASLPRLVFEYLRPEARPPTLADKGESEAQSLQRFVGSYLGERRSYRTLETLFATTGATAAVSIGEHGRLVLSYGDESRAFVRTGPLAFRALEDSDTLAFLEDEGGTIAGFATGSGHVVFDRVRIPYAAGTLFAALAVLGLVSLCLLVAAWARRGHVLRNGRGSVVVPGGRAPAWALGLAALVWLVFLAALALAFVEFAELGNDLVAAYPTPALRLAVGLAHVAAGLSLVAALLLPLAWWARGWGVWRRLRYTVAVVLMLCTSALLWHWNVLLAPLMLGG